MLLFPFIAWTVGPSWYAAVTSVAPAVLIARRFLASTIVFVAMLRRLDYRSEKILAPHGEVGLEGGSS